MEGKETVREQEENMREVRMRDADFVNTLIFQKEWFLQETKVESVKSVPRSNILRLKTK